MGIINKGSFPDALDKTIKTLYFEQFDEAAEMYSKVFTIEESESAYEKDSELSGFGSAVEYAEGEDIPSGSIYQAYDYTFTHLKYGLGFVITEEMMDDNRFKLMSKLPKALGEAFPRCYETIAATVWNNAFATDTYGDGTYLCSTAHTRPDGGANQSNVLTTPADLSPTSLQAAVIQLRKQRGLVGERLNFQPDILLIPPDLEFDAYTILNSIQLAGSANNDINALKHLYNIKPVVWPYLTDTDAWFLIAKKRDNLKFYWRKKPDLKNDLHLSTRDVEYNARMRFSVGVGPSGWRPVIGTPGA